MRYRFIGDTILTVPFLRNLRYNYPDAKIDVLVGPQSGSVLEGCPYINELITFDTTRFHKYDSGTNKPKNFFAYALDLAKRRYDTVFVLKRSLSSAILALLTGAKNRIGYATEGRDLLLTHKVKWDKNKHEVPSTLDVLECAGLTIKDNYMEAWPSQDEINSVRAKVPELGNFGKNQSGDTTDQNAQVCKLKVLIHAAAAHPDKMYPLELWAKVVQQIAKEKPIELYFTGGAADKDLYKKLEDLAGIKGHNLAGQLSLRESLALYAHMNLAICVDSGPAHLCSAANVPTITLFGPTDPERWRPWGEKHQAIYDESLACRPCNYKKTCSNRECLTELNPEKVARAALASISQY
jgi:heptosyltransferase-2